MYLFTAVMLMEEIQYARTDAPGLLATSSRDVGIAKGLTAFIFVRFNLYVPLLV